MNKCRFCGKDFKTNEELNKHIRNEQVKDVFGLYDSAWQ
jgi:hypothetical protein